MTSKKRKEGDSRSEEKKVEEENITCVYGFPVTLKKEKIFPLGKKKKT